MEILLLAYVVLAYQAVPHTIWAGKVIFGKWNVIIGQRLALALVFGWFLIPWWFLKKRSQ